MHRKNRLKRLSVFFLLTAVLLVCQPRNVHAAESKNIASSSSAANALQEEQQKGAEAARQKANAMVAAGKLNQLNADSADIQLMTESVRMSMPKNTQSFWFRIPKGTVLKDGCYLNLDMTLSGTLLENRSSITLEVNGTTLETKWICSVVKNLTGWWKVEIPVELLKTGDTVNELKITTAQRSIEGDCADIDNPSNWVRFDPDSCLHLAIEQYGKPYLGDLYSCFYDNLDDKNSIKNEFILPKTFDASLVDKMLKISSAIGANSQKKNQLNFRVSKAAPQDTSIKNKIYLGLLPDFTGNVDLTLPSGLNAGEGFLSVNGNNALVTGRDETGLKKAADFFSNSDYLNQIDNASLAVDSDVPDAAVGLKKNDTGYYTFRDFGYKDISLAGAFHQTANLNFTQPGGVKSGADSYIEVKFRHSKALNVDNSLLTVYFNGVAYGSVRLNSSNADSGSLKIRIPNDALDQEAISVKIDVYNYLGKIDCSKDWSDTAWTVIDKSSRIYLEPGSTGITPTLDNFPIFSALSSDAAKSVTMVTPDSSDTDILTLMSMVSAEAGQNSSSVLDCSVCDSPDKISAADKKCNMVFLGSYDTLRLPPEVSSSLAVVPSGKNGFRIAKGLTLSPETLKNKAVFQVIRSPWNFYKKIYVITYDSTMRQQLTKFLGDRQLYSQLSKQLSVADAQNHITSYSVGADMTAASEKVPLSWERLKYLIEKYTGIPIWVTMVILALVIICIILLIRLVRNKKRFQKAAEKMRRTIESTNENRANPAVTNGGLRNGDGGGKDEPGHNS